MDNLHAAIANMLSNCAGLAEGQSLLILTEDPQAGHYDAALPGSVAQVADAMGIEARQIELPHATCAEAPPPDVMTAIMAADRAVFLSRRGDQLRFDPVLSDAAPVMCYALDRQMMASGFGTADHRAFVALMDCLNTALAKASHIRVTCPLGTDFEGPGAAFPESGAETTVRRFPLSVFTPVPAGRYGGQIAVAGFLTGTGKTRYAPYDLALHDVLTVQFDGTAITGFGGADASAAAAHYDRVGALLGIEPRYVHSWHAGIHPGCAYRQSAADNVERWACAAFGNPRVLHFHTCGTVAPGEVSLNVIDPTIRLDGVAVWEDGRLYPERVAGGAAILAAFPCAARLFAAPETEIGLAPSGRLSLATSARSG